MDYSKSPLEKIPNQREYLWEVSSVKAGKETLGLKEQEMLLFVSKIILYICSAHLGMVCKTLTDFLRIVRTKVFLRGL